MVFVEFTVLLVLITIGGALLSEGSEKVAERYGSISRAASCWRW